MGGGSSFLAILRIAAFLFAIWAVGKGAKLLQMSTIVFEIVVGLILSPSVVGLMPPPYAECQHKDDYQCDTYGVETAILAGQTTKLYHLLQHHELCQNELREWEHVVTEYPAHRRLTHGHSDPEHEGEEHGEEETHPSTTAAPHSEGEGEGEGEHEDAGAHGGHEITPQQAASFNHTKCRAETPEHMVEQCAVFNELIECAEKECEAEIEHSCIEEPNVFTMLGYAGVSLVVFESGMHFDFEKARKVGVGACAVAVVGTILPIVAGMCMTWVYGEPLYPDGLAVGVALTPTSPVVALKLLLEAKQLQKEFGQAIITAAFVDDVLSLVAFNVLFAVTSGEFSLMQVVIKPIIGVIFMCIGGVMGLKVWPKAVEKLLSRVPPKSVPGGMSRQDEVLFLLVFVLLIGYASFTWWLGTHLWGCFVAGMSFACIHHVHHLWDAQLKRIVVWMLRIFFSCTVAFAIPVDELLSITAVWQGALMSLVACVFTKVFCAVFMGESRWVIGWAMVGRAEFAFLIAEMAKSSNVMSKRMFAVSIWALLWATIVTPTAFKRVLSNYTAMMLAREEKEGTGSESFSPRLSGGLHFTKGSTDGGDSQLLNMAAYAKGHCTQGGFKWIPCQLTCLHFQIIYPKRAPACRPDELKEIFNLLHHNGLIVINMEQKCDQTHHFSTFRAQPRDGKPLEESQLAFLQEELFKQLQGMSAHIVFLPPSASLQSRSKMAVIRMFANLLDFPLFGEHNGGGPIKVVSDIVRHMSNHEFCIIRAGLEMHGTTCITTVLISHPSRDVSARESGVSNLLSDLSDAPDITPEELRAVKKAIESTLDRRKVVAVVEPLTQAYDPLGGLSHEANVLSAGQFVGDESASTHEIRVFVDHMIYDLFPKLVEVLKTACENGTMGLLSAQVDEGSECKIKVLIMASCQAFKEEQKEELLDNLSNSFVNELTNGATGRIELTDVTDRDDRRVRYIGEWKQRAAFETPEQSAKGYEAPEKQPLVASAPADDQADTMTTASVCSRVSCPKPPAALGLPATSGRVVQCMGALKPTCQRPAAPSCSSGITPPCGSDRSTSRPACFSGVIPASGWRRKQVSDPKDQ